LDGRGITMKRKNTDRRSLREVVHALLLLVLVAGTAAAGSGAPGNVEPREAAGLMREYAGNPDFMVIDVRTPGEFAHDHLEGATLIDYRSHGFAKQIAELDRNKAYLIYCRTGNRSTGALAVMKGLGFRKVYHLDGGIERWRADGLPTRP